MLTNKMTHRKAADTQILENNYFKFKGVVDKIRTPYFKKSSKIAFFSATSFSFVQ